MTFIEAMMEWGIYGAGFAFAIFCFLLALKFLIKAEEAAEKWFK